VDSLRKMLETRNRLSDLIAKADRSSDLEGLLEEALQDADAMRKLSKELGIDVQAGDA
jgi:type VI secretion system protein ImpB